MGISWTAYCNKKFGVDDLCEETMYELYGEDCKAFGRYRYPIDSQQADIRYGYTEQEVQDKLMRRGAEALIEHELQIWQEENK